MELTREEAFRLHKDMWTNMLTELGEIGTGNSYNTLEAREKFKRYWCEDHFPDNSILEHCFLCEYAEQERKKNNYDKLRCYYCPINWGVRIDFGCEMNETSWCKSPISEILALPERMVE